MYRWRKSEEIMEEKLLSIIIPYFNGEEYIERVVSDITALNRDAVDFEIILVDDGSTDNAAEFCKQLISRYREIKYIRKDNGGIASARNAGLLAASGQYVTFADQDDRIVAGYKGYIDHCIKDDLDMLITSPYNRNQKEEKMNQRVFTDQTIADKTLIRKIAGKLIDGNYLSDENAPFISTSVWNVIYRKEMLSKNDIHFKAFIDYEDDWIFNIESLIHAEKIAISSKGYYCWIINNDSESHRDKYIPDLLVKRKNWMNWISEIIDKLDVSPEKAAAFNTNVLIPRNIMMCFNNACWNEGADKDDKLKEIREALGPEGWNIANVDIRSVQEMSFSNKFLLNLLKNNHLYLAYRLNCNILKNRFH